MWFQLPNFWIPALAWQSFVFIKIDSLKTLVLLRQNFSPSPFQLSLSVVCRGRLRISETFHKVPSPLSSSRACCHTSAFFRSKLHKPGIKSIFPLRFGPQWTCWDKTFIKSVQSLCCPLLILTRFRAIELRFFLWVARPVKLEKGGLWHWLGISLISPTTIGLGKSSKRAFEDANSKSSVVWKFAAHFDETVETRKDDGTYCHSTEWNVLMFCLTGLLSISLPLKRRIF